MWFNNGCNDDSTNGIGVVTGYVCNTASSGTMTAGISISGSGVTQTITADVASVGTYNISAIANGVTFAGSGTFAVTGPQTITLIATGTPTKGGSNSFTLNTTPTCSFSRVTDIPPAVVTSYICNTASSGTMTAGIPISGSGVTQTITADVASVGTYIISAIANGVTFSGSGTFAGIGPQTITLIATDTPTTRGSNSFTLNTTPSCSFSRSIDCGAYVSAGVFNIFMCHDLGANTSLNPDVPVQGINGNYYQWGRSTIVANASTSLGAMGGWNTTAAVDGSWSVASKTANDPCPAGFRVPTVAQWTGVLNTSLNTRTRTGSFVNDGNFTSSISFGTASTETLTLPAAGYRVSTNGTLINRSYLGTYWSSTESGTNAWAVSFNSSSAGTGSSNRNSGYLCVVYQNNSIYLIS